jgi:hypothetical protein
VIACPGRLPGGVERPLRPGLAEHVVQPNPEHLDLVREPVDGYVGSI